MQPAALRIGSEDGFILLWVIFLAVLLLIALAVAAPRVAISIQRDKELELIHRGQQYQRAIQLYYRKFGTYPTSIDQLLNTDNIRFLRKRYKDPLTGKADWRLIHLGEAKVPPMGFFGKPLSGLNGPTSIGSPIGGGVGTPATGTAGSPNSGTSGFDNSFGSSAFSSSSFGSSGFDSTGSTGFSNNTATSSANANSGSNSSNSSGDSKTDAAGFNTGNTGKDAAGFTTEDNSGANIGGGPIVGVGIPVPKPSLVAYKKQTHYNQWEFVYFPIEDQMRAAAAALNSGVQTQSGTSSGNDDSFGNPTGNGTSTTNGPGSGNGNFGSTNFGSDNSGSGSSGTGSSPNSSDQTQDQQQ
jgi:type II secretory pathway pseudopilin PulG